MTSPPFLGGGEPAGARPARRVLGRTGGTREAEMGKQEPQCGGAGGHRGAQGPAAEARGRHPQAERPLRGPDVPEARDREVGPAQPRAGRDRGAHHGAPSPLRAASSRSLTTARGRGSLGLGEGRPTSRQTGPSSTSSPRAGARRPAERTCLGAGAEGAFEGRRPPAGARAAAASPRRARTPGAGGEGAAPDPRGARRAGGGNRWLSGAPTRGRSIVGASGKLERMRGAGRQSARPPA